MAPRPLSHLVLLAALGGAASSSPHASAAPVITPRDAPGAVMPDRSWDVQHVSLAVQLDLDAGTVTGTVSHRVAPLARGSSWMRLHQAGLTLSEVLVDGKPAQYRQSQYSLDVVMPVDQPGEHVVTVSWSTKPETGLHFRGQPGSVDGYRAAWSQGEDEDNRYWLPLWDSPNDAFTLDTKVTVRDGLGAWANGSLDSVTPRGDGWTTHAFHLDQPIVGYLVAVVAGEYQELEATAPCPEGLVGCAPLPLTYIVPRSWSAADAEATFAATPRVIRFLEGLLQQPYPYPIYRQAIAPRFIYQGMENASLTTIRDSLALKPGDARRYRTDEVVAHEAAHQWFGDLVTCESWRDLWLNEGFATYYAGRFLRADEGAEAYSIEHRSWRQAALRRAAPMSARAWSIGDEGPNTGVYVRGASVLHSLESLLGPETFDAAIADYVHQHRFQLVRTEDLREVLEAHSGKDLAWFFDAWVHGRGWPELTTHWGHRDGELSISINQTSTAKSGQFYAPIDVLVGLANGDELKRTVWLGAGETQLVLPTDVPPAYVAIDPNGTLIGVIKQQQDPAAWLAQLQRVSTPDAKLDAINALIAGVPDQPALDAISEQLRSTTHHPIWRAEVAKQLGHLKTEGGLRVLASAAKDAHPVVREAVADALATASHVELASSTLTALLRDPHPVVRASALAALVKHDPQAALREAKRNLGQPKLDDTIRRMALYVLAEAGDEKDIALALRFTDARYERGVRIQAGEAAHTHASALDEQQQQAAYERILDAVLPNLHDPDLRMREATIELVGAVGGEEARTALRALLAETLHPEVRAEIEDAIAQSWNHDPATPAKPTPTELQDVQTELDAIKKRLKDVEAWR